MRSCVRACALAVTMLLLCAALGTQAQPQGGEAQQKPNPRALRSAAEAAAGKGDHAAAIKLWGSLLEVERTQINYFHRASSYLKKHQYAHALHDLNSALELDPKFYKGLMFRARVHKVTGACDAALTDLRALLAAQPAHKEATSELPKVTQCASLVQQATAMLSHHQWDHAKHLLTQALDIAYDSRSLTLQRIQCHAALKDWQSVLVDTRKVLQADKSDMEALYIRGRAYYFLGEHDNALTHWKEGLRLDPEHKQMKEATKALRLLLRRMSNADQSLQSNPQESLEEAEAALAMDPEHTVIRPGLHIKRADALLALKRHAEAYDAANAALANGNENYLEGWLRRGQAKLGLQEWEAAVQDFTKATQLQQGHQQAQQLLHQAQIELKKSKEKDFYKELGLPRDANARAIKKAYRAMALLWHPDKHEKDEDKLAAEKKFQAVAEAYEVLSDPEQKRKYDAGEWQPGNQQQQQQQQHHGGFQFHGFQQHFRWG